MLVHICVPKMGSQAAPSAVNFLMRWVSFSSGRSASGLKAPGWWWLGCYWLAGPAIPQTWIQTSTSGTWCIGASNNATSNHRADWCFNPDLREAPPSVAQSEAGLDNEGSVWRTVEAVHTTELLWVVMTKDGIKMISFCNFYLTWVSESYPHWVYPSFVILFSANNTILSNTILGWNIVFQNWDMCFLYMISLVFVRKYSIYQ